MVFAKLAKRLVALWYLPHKHWFSLLLLPLAWLYQFVTSLRRYAYSFGLLKSYQASVPVIVVGNITVGGTGKTPMVIWLVEFLRQQGFKPGVVSRGYGTVAKMPQLVSKESKPAQVGDEPLLIHWKTHCPVVVCQKRVLAVQALLEWHPDCDVIISDDGLQHYALSRQIEIAMLDERRRCGNRLLLPAGPLREPARRLQMVDFVVMTCVQKQASSNPQIGSVFVNMELTPDKLYALHDPSQTVDFGLFKDRVIHAIAGIANPQRFFTTLRAMKLRFFSHDFPDHYCFTEQDLSFGENSVVVMTEKDAVKCRLFARDNLFALSVSAQLPVSFGEQLLERLLKRKCELYEKN